jgi:hypothetical protein
VDKRKKIFFIVLAVIVVLYFASLGTGIWLNQGGDGGQPKDLSAVTDQWVSGLGPALSAFAPALDLSGLRCDDQPVNRIFQLRVSGLGQQGCAIRIPVDPDEDYRKTELSTVGSEVGVYVRALFERDRFDPKDKAENCYLDDQRLPDGLRLEVRYEPNESSDEGMWKCWLAQEPGKPVTITAMKDGGTLHLTMRCDNCKDGPGCKKPCKDATHRVRLRMK